MSTSLSPSSLPSTSPPPEGCPIDRLLRILMGPWTTYILWVLRQGGPLRFGALKRQVTGISAKMLTERLRMLSAQGIIYRDHVPTIPPQVTYGLTERGEELGDFIDGLEAIALKWEAEEAAWPSRSQADNL